ncbi:MAG: VOC family protein [Saccharofermentanales bacterium]
MNSTGSGFHHIAMKAMDFDKVVAFYTDGMGYEKGISWGEGDNRAVMIHVGKANYIEIFAGAKEIIEQEGTLLHIALKSLDCDGDIARAAKAGATVTIEPVSIDIPSEPVKQIRIAFCKGLNGEILEFFQEL